MRVTWTRILANAATGGGPHRPNGEDAARMKNDKDRGVHPPSSPSAQANSAERSSQPTTAPKSPEPSALRGWIARRLLGWFTQSQRRLPWRRDRNPYRIWISEVMLQQTQVATVVPYFERFLQAFPTLSALAAADEQEVLRLRAGLR